MTWASPPGCGYAVAIAVLDGTCQLDSKDVTWEHLKIESTCVKAELWNTVCVCVIYNVRHTRCLNKLCLKIHKEDDAK